MLSTVEQRARRECEGVAIWLARILHPLLEVNAIVRVGLDSHPWPAMDAHLTACAPKIDDMLQYEYARSALRLGLGREEQLGTNRSSSA